MTWFKEEFGFEEEASVENYEGIKNNFTLENNNADENGIISKDVNILTCKVNNYSYQVGAFDVLSLTDLKNKLNDIPAQDLGSYTFENIVAESKSLHMKKENENSIMQVASQFNALEMIGPYVKPEDGITRYIFDKTQGPACALACPAATLYRNYFGLSGKGQTENEQINTTEDILKLIENDKHNIFSYHNGYLLPTKDGENGGVANLSERLSKNDELYKKVHASLKIAVHWSTEVSEPLERIKNKQTNKWELKKRDNSNNSKRLKVCQVFNSALPVAYSRVPSSEWEVMAKLILNASYEATLICGAILARTRGARVKIFLTKLGGGAFGNEPDWIMEAISGAIKLYRDEPLDIYLTHYGVMDKEYIKFSTKS